MLIARQSSIANPTLLQLRQSFQRRDQKKKPQLIAARQSANISVRIRVILDLIKRALNSWFRMRARRSALPLWQGGVRLKEGERNNGRNSSAVWWMEINLAEISWARSMTWKSRPKSEWGINSTKIIQKEPLQFGAETSDDNERAFRLKAHS